MRIYNRNRDKDLAKLFTDEDAGLIYCNDVNELMKAVGYKHIASEQNILKYFKNGLSEFKFFPDNYSS